MGQPTGKYVINTTAGEEVKAFVPNSLPPIPRIEAGEDIQNLIRQCEISLSELKIATSMIPDKGLFAYTFVRKEAILSSQIENIQATLTDLFSFESEIIEIENSDEVQEVCNYIDALKYAQRQINLSKGLPISKRLFQEIHKRIMKGVRGSQKKPGEFRQSQNWVGGTRPGNAQYVPPPPSEMNKCLDQLEKYIHQSNQDLHPLVKIGLIHVQFESIHPFLDGNGRLGRLLIVLLLEKWGLSTALSFYPSLHFKRHRNKYYDLLTGVRISGDWEAWNRFFLEAINISAQEATLLAQNIFELQQKFRIKLINQKDISMPTIRLFELLPSHPILNMNRVVEILNVTKPTANKALTQLQNANVLRETTSGQRNRVFVYKNYLDLLTKDTG